MSGNLALHIVKMALIVGESFRTFRCQQTCHILASSHFKNEDGDWGVIYYHLSNPTHSKGYICENTSKPCMELHHVLDSTLSI